MQIVLSRKADKFLDKQGKSDPKSVRKIRTFLFKYLATAKNPTALPNCKKMQGTDNNWRWRVGDYRIIAEVRAQELLIQVIKIAHRQEAYN